MLSVSPLYDSMSDLLPMFQNWMSIYRDHGKETFHEICGWVDVMQGQQNVWDVQIV